MTRNGHREESRDIRVLTEQLFEDSLRPTRLMLLHESSSRLAHPAPAAPDAIHAAEADHLDVVGQFGRFDGTSWGGDWIPSYARFDQARFEALWADVARFIAKGQREPELHVGTERTEHDLPNRP